MAEKKYDAAPDPLTNEDATSTSMQAEGQATAEKELEDEWASEDEEPDQGAALLTGFDSDGEDNAEDVSLKVGEPPPTLTKRTSKKAWLNGRRPTVDGRYRMIRSRPRLVASMSDSPNTLAAAGSLATSSRKLAQCH